MSRDLQARRSARTPVDVWICRLGKPEVRVTPREQAAGHRRPRATRRSAPRRCARRSALRSGYQDRQPLRAALPRLVGPPEQRTAGAAAGSMNKLVQVQCARGASSDEAGALPVGPGRDPHIASSRCTPGLAETEIRTTAGRDELPRISNRIPRNSLRRAAKTCAART